MSKKKRNEIHKNTVKIDSHQPVTTPQDTDCPTCFLTPCIAERHVDLPYLQGGGQAPCMHNIGIRHHLYKSYWKLIDNSGGWRDSRYLAKKSKELNDCALAVGSRREIMPICIVTKLRKMFPNPENVCYVGHEW